MKKSVKYKSADVSHVSYLRVISEKFFQTNTPVDDERWSSTNIITPKKLELVTINDKYWDIVTDYAVSPGDELYIVWVVYSLSDEDGTETGMVDYIGAYKHMADMYAVVDALQNMESGCMCIELMLPSGAEEILWCTMFNNPNNHVEDVKYEKLMVY